MHIPGFSVTHELHRSERTLILQALSEAGDEVVLKMPAPEYPLPEHNRRIQREFAMLRRLGGLSGIRAHRICEFGHRLTLVMDDCRGTALSRRWTGSHADRPKPLSPPAAPRTMPLSGALQIALALASVVEEIHHARIIHKHINPQHILLDREDQVVALIDFSIASEIPWQATIPSSPESLQGWLPYISPEQTGRMNRPIDYRSDFYSMGITLYELFSGVRPFSGDDPMEIVHAHIAKAAPPLNHICGHISDFLAAVVGKLMAKNPEQRYQSIGALKADLARGIAALDAPEHTSCMVPGIDDRAQTLQIPAKLYGRDRDIDQFLDIFRAVCSGRTELVLVTGYSGVGKSALVREVHRPMTAQRGHYIAGKYDQFHNNTPYSALTQAFTQWVHYILSQDERALSSWKRSILDAVGDTGSALIEVIPTIELIIGAQPAIAAVGPQEAQNRFNEVFRRFVAAISSPKHPLILFLDDLQWIDPASLRLLQLLAQPEAPQSLLIIGAYRDNEVDAGHPLSVAVGQIKERDHVGIHTISLGNLSLSSVTEMLADALSQPPESLTPLAELIHQKTRGNAFFTREFLASLQRGHLLHFQAETRTWHWDIGEIRKRDITDNVVELVAATLAQLPEASIELITLAAIYGNQLDLGTLALIANMSLADTVTALEPIISGGALIPLDEDYYLRHQQPSADTHFRFQHDRVQQAAASLIDPADKADIHVRIGRRLRASTPEPQTSDRLFDIVGQLNAGAELLRNRDELLQLAQLNLWAGQRARQSSAYDAATEYLRLGRQALGEQGWDDAFSLTYDVCSELVQCHGFFGQVDQANALLDVLFERTDDARAQGQLLHERIKLHNLQGRYADALNVAIGALSLLGMTLPAVDDVPAIRQRFADETAWYRNHWGHRAIAELYDMPLSDDPRHVLELMLITEIVDCCAYVSREYFAMASMMGVNLCIRHGNTAMSPVAYVWHAITMSRVFHDFRGAWQFAELAIRVDGEKLANSTTTCKVYNLSTVLWHLAHHARGHRATFDHSYTVGLALGDWTNACYSRANQVVINTFCAKDLHWYRDDSRELIDIVVNKFNNVAAAALVSPCMGLAANLRDETASVASLHCPDFDEAMFVEHFSGIPIFFDMLHYCHAVARLYAEDYAAAADIFAAHALAELDIYPLGEQRRYYAALAFLFTMREQELDEDTRRAYRERVDEYSTYLQKIAEAAPMNFRAHAHLVTAETILLDDGNLRDAIFHYKQAMELAAEHHFLQDQALATERLTETWLALGHTDVAQIYAPSAIDLYHRWGAHRKANILRQRYTAILGRHLDPPADEGGMRPSSPRPRVPTEPPSALASVAGLDAVSMIKASQAISGQRTLARLLQQVMDIAVENAGAQRGLLLLPGKDGFLVGAEANVDWDQVNVYAERSEFADTSLSLEDSTADASPKAPIPPQTINVQPDHRYPSSVVNYVIRTQTLAIGSNLGSNLDSNFNDESGDSPFDQDPYFGPDQQAQATEAAPSQIAYLCMPLINRGQIVGVLYLENRRATDVFTAQRVQVLELLLSQMVISLQNALLYETLEMRVAERTQALSEAQSRLVDAARRAGMAEMAANVLHNLGNLLNSVNRGVMLAKEQITAWNSAQLIQVGDSLQKTDFAQWDHGRRHKLGHYVHRLAEVYQQDRTQVLGELEAAKDGIEHMEALIRMQQQFAAAPQLVESVSPVQIIEDALGMNQAILQRNGIRVEKNYVADLPKMMLERHKILQILINLLVNASQAMDTIAEDNRILTIEIGNRQTDQLVYQVRDTGVGIPATNLDRIFNLGFSTREGGTGAGLHYSALAAQDLGGSLTAASEGRGCGSAFTLTVPLHETGVS